MDESHPRVEANPHAAGIQGVHEGPQVARPHARDADVGSGAVEMVAGGLALKTIARKQFEGPVTEMVVHMRKDGEQAWIDFVFLAGAPAAKHVSDLFGRFQAVRAVLVVDVGLDFLFVIDRVDVNVPCRRRQWAGAQLTVGHHPTGHVYVATVSLSNPGTR